MMMKTSKVDRGIAEGYRSGLEEQIAKQLEDLGQPVLFETIKLEYHKPASKHKYTPDFILANGIVIESKGRFVTADRKKHKLVKEQHPEVDIRFIFSNSRTRISKQSTTTYAQWCEQNGFKYADKYIPLAWLTEKPNVNQ
jgi:hypothetical protein